jgi:hypothetical protein
MDLCVPARLRYDIKDFELRVCYLQHTLVILATKTNREQGHEFPKLKPLDIMSLSVPGALRCDRNSSEQYTHFLSLQPKPPLRLLYEYRKNPTKRIDGFVRSLNTRM